MDKDILFLNALNAWERSLIEDYEPAGRCVIGTHEVPDDGINDDDLPEHYDEMNPSNLPSPIRKREDI